jgi:chemotaxis signal transduction protein
LAVKTDEVAGISQWPGSIAVPSRTPFVSAVVRREREVLPVFDLANLLHVTPRGDTLLCITAKHPRGPMAICIDEEMPVLHHLDAGAMRAYRGSEFEAVGSFQSGLDEIPILSFATLGSI